MLFLESERVVTELPDGEGISSAPEPSLWRTVRHLWCRHQTTFRTEKTDVMPAHTVCRSCGWREPVVAGQPLATRTWDSTRDETRYEREKKRREAIAVQRQVAVAQRAMPSVKESRPRRTRRSNVVQMARMAR